MTDGPFAALGLHHSYCDTVASMGFEKPSDIQQAAIPEVLAHKDILGIAQTGTGNGRLWTTATTKFGGGSRPTTG